MITFVCWVAVVALSAAFLISLADKWGWREWLQVHADAIVSKWITRYNGDFFNRLFSCNFCCGWWVAVIISLTLLAVTGHWWFIFVPVCSTIITRNLL